MPVRHPTIISECPMLLRVSPMNAYLISWIGLSLCSRIVITSASICVGWYSAVRPLKTGTPAYFCELVNACLAGAAILDGVVHASQHARGVLERLLVADLRAGRIEIGHVRALVVAGDLERAARARRCLLEDQADLLVGEMLLLGARVFGALEIAREVEQVAEFPRRVVLHRQQRAIAQIEAHDCLPGVAGQSDRQYRPGRVRSGRSCSARRRGRDRAPTPRTVITSIPALRSKRVRVRVAVVSDHHARRERHDVVAVVPLLALGFPDIAAGFDDAKGLQPEASLTTSKRCRLS